MQKCHFNPSIFLLKWMICWQQSDSDVLLRKWFKTFPTEEDVLQEIVMSILLSSTESQNHVVIDFVNSLLQDAICKQMLLSSVF